MRLIAICLVMVGAASLAVGDAGLLRGKARLWGKLARHQKRGVLGAVPTFKLGHDIPHVTHSVVKPLVVTYPPAATVTTVKVPLSHPLVPRFPHGHHAPAPHPHFGQFSHTKSVVLPRPDQHFHHHHHHVAPRPVLPPPVLPAAPVVPLAQPTVPVPQPLPPPLPLQPAPLLPAPPLPLQPQPLPVLPHRPHVAPLLPATALPLQPAPIFPAPAVPYAPQLQYVLRPGNAIQTSVFATYPRYPLLNYRPLIPFTAPGGVGPIPVASASPPVLFGHPQAPHYHVAPNAVLPQASPALVVASPAPTPGLHAHPPQPAPIAAVEHDGWAPLPPHSHDVALHDAEHAFAQDVHHQYSHDVHQQFAHEAHPQFAHEAHPQFAHEAHPQFPQEAHAHFSQEQGTQVYEHHTGEEQHYHELQHQLQHQIQDQLAQAQFEQHLHDQHQLSQEYGAPQLSQEYSPQDGGHGQDFSQHQDFSQRQGGVEGRSGEGEAGGGELQYRDHIPLGLQPPLDRPLDHFR